MDVHLVAAVHFNHDQHWQLCFASTDGFRLLVDKIFENTPKGKQLLIDCIANQFKKLTTESTRVIFVRTCSVIDPFYYELYNVFAFPRVIHVKRLQLHQKRIGRQFGTIAELAAEAAVTGLRVEELLLETTNICTFNCLYCPQDQITRKKERIPLATALKVIDEYAANSIGSMSFHIMGEPTTNPDLPKIIKHVADHHIEHALITNASLLNREKAEELFANGLMHMMISVQTHTPEQHTAFKRPAPKYTYEKVLRNIKDILIAKWAKAPDAILQLHIMDTTLYQPRGVKVVSNNDEALEVMNFWVDFVTKAARESNNIEILKQITTQDSLDITKGCWPHNACTIEPNVSLTFKMAGHWTQNFLKEDEFILPASKGSCPPVASDEPRLLAIQSNGDVVMCCFDYDGGTRIANIHEQSLTEIDKQIISYRKKLLNSSEIPFSTCGRCLGVRVKILGKKTRSCHEVDFEIANKSVGVWGQDASSLRTGKKLQSIGIEVAAYTEFNVKGDALISLLSNENDTNQCKLTKELNIILFPPEWQRDTTLLQTLEKRYPKTTLAQLDIVALNPFDRVEIEKIRSLHSQEAPLRQLSWFQKIKNIFSFFLFP